MPRGALAATIAIAGLAPGHGDAGVSPCDRSSCPKQSLWASIPLGSFKAGSDPCECQPGRPANRAAVATRAELLEVGVASWSLGIASGVLLQRLVARLVAQVPPPRPAEDASPADDDASPAADGEEEPQRQGLARLRGALLGERGDGIPNLPIPRTKQAAWRGLGFCTAILVGGLSSQKRWREAFARLCQGRRRQDGVSTKRPLAMGVPVFPGAKGAGKAGPPGKGAPPPKGAGKGGPPAKGAGKGKAPPPKAKSMLTPRPGTPRAGAEEGGIPVETPFGRKIHWVQPKYDEPIGDTVFGKLGASEGPGFDPKLLTAIFTPSTAERKRSWNVTKEVGKCILDTQRAQSAAIMVNRLKMNTGELVRCVNTLDFDDTRLRVDDVEIVTMAMPTPEESAKLLNCGCPASELRDIEQKLIPLCSLSAGSLRVMKFGLTHATMHADIIGRCGVIRTAAEEAQQSTQFMEFLRLSLQVGNFINHGEAEMKQGMVRAFALESLQMLSSCKAGPVSALHFVCLTLRSEDPNFLTSLRNSLSHVREAAREKTAALEGDVQSFSNEVKFVRTRLQNLKAEDEVRDKMQRLLNTLEEEDRELKVLLQKSLTAASDSQTYFNVSVKEGSKPPTSDQFFGCIAKVLENIQTAWHEVESHGRRWQRKFEGKEEATTTRPKGRAKKAATVSLGETNDSDASASGAELTKVEPNESGEDALVLRREARKSAPALMEKVPTLRLNKGKRPLKGSALKPPPVMRRPPYLPKTSPRPEVPLIGKNSGKVCEFHIMHDDSDADGKGKGTPLGGKAMPRSSTAFPDLCDFEFLPSEKAEMTWDFEISGNGTGLLAHQWRREKQLKPEVQKQLQILRQKTC